MAGIHQPGDTDCQQTCAKKQNDSSVDKTLKRIAPFKESGEPAAVPPAMDENQNTPQQAGPLMHFSADDLKSKGYNKNYNERQIQDDFH
jgi:hypothetical protein